MKTTTTMTAPTSTPTISYPVNVIDANAPHLAPARKLLEEHKPTESLWPKALRTPGLYDEILNGHRSPTPASQFADNLWVCLTQENPVLGPAATNTEVACPSLGDLTHLIKPFRNTDGERVFVTVPAAMMPDTCREKCALPRRHGILSFQIDDLVAFRGAAATLHLPEAKAWQAPLSGIIYSTKWRQFIEVLRKTADSHPMDLDGPDNAEESPALTLLQHIAADLHSLTNDILGQPLRTPEIWEAGIQDVVNKGFAPELPKQIFEFDVLAETPNGEPITPNGYVNIQRTVDTFVRYHNDKLLPGWLSRKDSGKGSLTLDLPKSCAAAGGPRFWLWPNMTSQIPSRGWEKVGITHNTLGEAVNYLRRALELPPLDPHTSDIIQSQLDSLSTAPRIPHLAPLTGDYEMPELTAREVDPENYATLAMWQTRNAQTYFRGATGTAVPHDLLPTLDPEGHFYSNTLGRDLLGGTQRHTAPCETTWLFGGSLGVPPATPELHLMEEVLSTPHPYLWPPKAAPDYAEGARQDIRRFLSGDHPMCYSGASLNPLRALAGAGALKLVSLGFYRPEDTSQKHTITHSEFVVVLLRGAPSYPNPDNAAPKHTWRLLDVRGSAGFFYHTDFRDQLSWRLKDSCMAKLSDLLVARQPDSSLRSQGHFNEQIRLALRPFGITHVSSFLLTTLGASQMLMGGYVNFKRGCVSDGQYVVFPPLDNMHLAPEWFRTWGSRAEVFYTQGTLPTA